MLTQLDEHSRIFSLKFATIALSVGQIKGC